VPLVPVLVAMELNGVAVDMPYLEALAKRLGERLVALEDEIYQAVGTPFNINSPVQLADVLFGQLGLSAPGGRKTSTGKASVAADVLDSMKGQHPVIDLVLEHRQLSKIKGTYLDALPRLVNPTTHRVHTTFSQVSAVSGRLASQDPNLQNIPIRTELGREVRRGFVAAPGNVLISADYSQVELRICAHISGDPGLRAAFEAGEDIHRATAAKVLGLATESVTADQRSFAKRINFGLLYGMGAQSLAQQAGISMKEAQQFVDAYFATFPKVRQYIDETKRKAREEGFVETLLGRRRYFPILATTTRDARTNIMQRTAEREAVNHPLQGTAADIIKIAMLRIHAALIERDQGEMLTLQVHDELVLDTPAAIAEETAALVRELMESAYPLDPPLKVDVGLGPNWDAVK
jgi:DNA polymerase-1